MNGPAHGDQTRNVKWLQLASPPEQHGNMGNEPIGQAKWRVLSSLEEIRNHKKQANDGEVDEGIQIQNLDVPTRHDESLKESFKQEGRDYQRSNMGTYL